MAKQLLTLILATLAAAAMADAGIKPGLWQMRITKNIVDGHDNAAQMDGLNDKMKEQMARLTPEQRQQMGATTKQRGMNMPTAGGSIQMCITPELAKRDVPVTDKDGSCQPTKVRRSGNRMTYEFNCTSEGTKTTGTGESIVQGDTVTSRSDLMVVDHGESHQVQSESEMRFVKSDCGDVKPIAHSNTR